MWRPHAVVGFSMTARLSGLALLALIGTAQAHTVGHHVQVAEAASWSAVSFEPSVTVPLLLSGLLYAIGVRSAWQRAGQGRGVRWSELLCFAAGMGAIVLALVWPLDTLGEQLFSGHMAQHLMLMNVAAPLLVLGAPLQVMVRPLPRSWKHAIASLVQSSGWRSAWRQLSRVGVATLLQLLVLWAWHTPQGIAAALHDEAIHIVMHISLLASALLFWTAVLRSPRERFWGPIVGLVVTFKVTGLVCIFLLLEPHALYLAYGDRAMAWGLTAVDDEKLGWGVMMIVASLSYVVAAVALLCAWFARLEKRLPATASGARSARAGPLPREAGSVQRPG